MQKNHSVSAPATPTGRVRHRNQSNEVPSEASKADKSHLLVNDQNKHRSTLIRAYSSIWMIGGFAFIIYIGHLYIWAMVVVIQIFWRGSFSVYLGDLTKTGSFPDSGF